MSFWTGLTKAEVDAHVDFHQRARTEENETARLEAEIEA